MYSLNIKFHQRWIHKCKFDFLINIYYLLMNTELMNNKFTLFICTLFTVDTIVFGKII